MSDELTRREIQCVRLAGKSYSNKEIAAQLKLSPSTVNNHLSAAYAKLGTSNRGAAAAIVARDYPEDSRFRTIPMALDGSSDPSVGRPGENQAIDADSTPSTWPLPAPPRSIIGRLVGVLGFAAVAAVITIGLVAIVEAALSNFSAVAPANAVQAPTSTQSGAQNESGEKRREGRAGSA